MKTIISSVVLFSFFVLSAFPQTSNIAGINNSPDKSQISFIESEYDFGIINYKNEAVHYFVFLNSGKTPLVISNVRTSCGCTVPVWPQGLISGGKKDSLRVEYNTKVKGAFNKTISVYSNAANSMVELRIKGNVINQK